MDTDLKGWCVTSYTGGVSHSTTHKLMPYTTLFLRRPMYYCSCGIKCSPEEYKEYCIYLIKRRKAIDKYMNSL